MLSSRQYYSCLVILLLLGLVTPLVAQNSRRASGQQKSASTPQRVYYRDSRGRTAGSAQCVGKTTVTAMLAELPTAVQQGSTIIYRDARGRRSEPPSNTAQRPYRDASGRLPAPPRNGQFHRLPRCRAAPAPPLRWAIPPFTAMPWPLPAPWLASNAGLR